MPMIDSTPLVVTLVVEVDGHRLEFVESVRTIHGARYDGADPRAHGYSPDNSLERKIRDHLDATLSVAVERAQVTARRLYPTAADEGSR